MIEYQHSTLHFSKNKVFSLTRYNVKSGLHFHSAVEFVFILSGSLQIYLDGEIVSANSGDIALINSSVMHSFKITSTPLDYYVLIVSDEFLKTHSLYSETVEFSPIIRSKKASDILNEIILENERADNFSSSLIEGKIIELLVLINRNFSKTKPEPSFKAHKKTDIVKETLDYLKVNFKKKLSVDEISSSLAFSKSYLSHAFKEVTGYSIISYVNLLKCQCATALIKGGSTISQACAECGFTDLSYFTRIFKKTMGYLPSEIKK